MECLRDIQYKMLFELSRCDTYMYIGSIFQFYYKVKVHIQGCQMQEQDNPPVIFDHPSREFQVTNASQAHCQNKKTTV